MDSITRAPRGATAVPRPAPLSQNQAEQLRRSILSKAARAAIGIEAAEAAYDGGEQRVLSYAWGFLNSWKERLQDCDLNASSASFLLNELRTIAAFVDAAGALENDKPCGVALESVKAILRGLLTELEHSHFPAGENYERTMFLRGKAMLADMLEALADDQIGSELEAGYRGRDVDQNTSAVSACIDKLRNDCGGALEAGFIAALTGCLSMGFTGSLADSDYFRDLTYEDVKGGPDTQYEDDEVDPDGAAAEVSNESKPVFTSPSEIILDESLQQIDLYLEGLEHVDIGEPAHTLLHAQAIGHYYAARELLDKHATLGQILFELTALRAGLKSVAAVIDKFNTGWPLVQWSITVLEERILEPVDEDLHSPERTDVARQAATFIDRLVAYFQTATHPGTMGDLDAIGQAASVILSALDDPVEDADSIRERLERALESTSVILRDQPPAYWNEPGILRERDVGKRFVQQQERLAA